jgi:DegV family protein with EDD domain
VSEVFTNATAALVTDSTADLPGGMPPFENVRIVPLIVRFGDEEYRDWVDLTPEAFYHQLAGASVTPTTSQPSPEAFATTYRELFDEGYRHIFSLHLSSRVSGTVQSAQLAAEGFDGRVTVIDTRQASAAISLCLLGVRARLEGGVDEAGVLEYVDGFIQRARLVFSVATLEYLQKGGRIGAARALLGGLLSVKPILGLRDGEVVALGRVRGASRVVPALVQELVDGSPAGGPLRLAVADAEAPEQVTALLEAVRRVRPEAVLEVSTRLGAVIGTYSGPGAFGMMWVPEPPTDARLGVTA